MINDYNIRKILIVMALLVAMCGIVSGAMVTQSITYQGKVTDVKGNPLMGSYEVTFSLYETASGGTALTSDSHYVEMSEGLFTTSILTDPEVLDGRTLWLGIAVSGDPEMTPRQEIRPVPYAMSLRPGAWITSDVSSFALNVKNTATNGYGAYVLTTGVGSHGMYSEADGEGSNAIVAEAIASDSRGIHAITWGENSRGVVIRTEGTYSPGMVAETLASYSNGINVITSSDHSRGVDISTKDTYSPGILTHTTGQFSEGIYSETDGPGSPAVVAESLGYGSDGVAAVTWNDHSTGVDVRTEGIASEAVSAVTLGSTSNAIYASTKGTNSYGIYAISGQGVAIRAETGKVDNKYGVQTPDIIRALNYETGSSDAAEYMPVDGDTLPGTVLVIGPGGILRPSGVAYDTRVAGIVSTAPGLTLGADEEGNPGKALVAVAGRVPCRVDATFGAIHAGDLLTTSATPGYAMKAEPIEINGRTFYPSGIVLAKAMGDLERGTGTIDVLVTLQ